MEDSNSCSSLLFVFVKVITSGQFEEEEKMDEYLTRLNQHVKQLAFAPRVPIREEMYSTW